MTQMKRLAITLLIGAFLLAVPAESSFAAQNASNTQNITFPFLDTINEVYTWSFPYSDDFFRTPSGEFNIEMARGSLGLAVSTFRSIEHVVKPQYKTYLTGAGFRDLAAFGFDKPTTADSLSGIIGSKKIDDVTVIAAAACGQGYENEWAGNLKVGKGDRHQGFEKASLLFQKHISKYIADNGIKGKKVIWLTGYSRASAVANITAADLIESGDYEDVYAYLFAVPRTTKKPVAYSGIYNFCGQYDPVPGTPLQSWGFERYGTDLFTPSQEADPDYDDLKKAADAVCTELTSMHFHNNPELNFQFYLILEFMGEFFPTSDDYVDRFQDILMETWTTPDFEHFTAILNDAMMDVDTNNTLEDHSRSVFINYLSYIAAQHVGLDQKQVDEGYWNPDESVTANLVLEHRASTYVNWLFADVPVTQLLNGSMDCRRITFLDDVSIIVRKDDAAGELATPLIMKNGSETMLSIPSDHAYQVTVKRKGSSVLTYYDEQVSPLHLMPDPGTIYIATANDAKYTLHLLPGEDLPQLTRADGSSLNAPAAPFDASPVSIMKSELNSIEGSYLTLNEALKIASFILCGFVLLLLWCFVIFLIHRRRVKIGHQPYSDWYVIVPHLLCIVTFVALTIFATLNLYSIINARAECACIAMFFVFLLSLRGLLRNRTLRNVLFTIFTLLFTLWLHQYYGRFILSPSVIANVTVYTIIVGILSWLAAIGFRKRKREQE